MEHRRLTVREALWLGLCLAVGVSPTARSGTDEAEIKAAFVYNFAKFVEWPAEAFSRPDAPLALCISGHDAVEAGLRHLEGREAQGRRLQVRQVDTPEEIAGCHVLFVAGPETPQQGQLLQSVREMPLLTVADRRDFGRQGGVISLFVEANRVQFSVNLYAAQSRGLKFSARLLQLARVPR